MTDIHQVLAVGFMCTPKLEKISDFFWKEGTCQLQVKVKANASEAIIEAGKKFKFQPTLENLNYLDDIFGSGALKIN